MHQEQGHRSPADRLRLGFVCAGFAELLGALGLGLGARGALFVTEHEQGAGEHTYQSIRDVPWGWRQRGKLQGPMLLDLSSLGKALASLDRAAIRAQASPDDEELRDAVIQRFEYTYELSWKMRKRHLEQVVPDPARIDGLSFRELIGEGAERGIVAEPEPWFEYRHQQNLTSHAYNSAAAQSV